MYSRNLYIQELVFGLSHCVAYRFVFSLVVEEEHEYTPMFYYDRYIGLTLYYDYGYSMPFEVWQPTLADVSQTSLATCLLMRNMDINLSHACLTY